MAGGSSNRSAETRHGASAPSTSQYQANCWRRQSIANYGGFQRSAQLLQWWRHCRNLRKNFTQALQVFGDLSPISVIGLRLRNGVIGVADGHVRAANLAIIACGYAKAGSVILGAIDAYA